MKHFQRNNKLPLQYQSQSDVGDVEQDGRLCETSKDPPGQKSHYIIPGDKEKESYRLSTYLKFPPGVPVDLCSLARNGFYFTGYKDRVKCFSCGSSVESWASGDNPASDKWHYDDCDIRNGKDIFNVPIRGLGSFLTGSAAKFGQSSISSDFSQSSSETHDSGYASTSTYSHDQVMADEAISTQNSEQPSNIVMNLAKLEINGVNESSATSSGRQQTVHQTATFVKKPIPFGNIVNQSHRQVLAKLELWKEEDRRKSFPAWAYAQFCVTIEELARCGFFYLGNSDRVQCFSCHGILKKWLAVNSVEQEHEKHFQSCKMVLGTEEDNEPLPPSERPQSPESIGDEEDSDQSPLSAEERQQLRTRFPCRTPATPRMNTVANRVSTFDRNWAAYRVIATNRQIAHAGFYYLGVRDRTKCWYCNGGLQNWERDDDPWREHAKWFPGCEYILQQRGVEYVRSIVALYPDLRRPAIRNARTDYLEIPRSQNRTSPVMTAGEVMTRHVPPSSPPANQTSVREFRQTAMDEIMTTQARHMGFNVRRIQGLIQRKWRETGQGFSDLGDLIEALVNLAGSGEDIQADDDVASDQTPNHQQTTVVSNTNTSSSASEIVSQRPPTVSGDPSLKRKEQSTVGGSEEKPPKKFMKMKDQNVVKELEDLETQRKCKHCLVNCADHVIIPCGHLSICENCTKTAKRCAICKHKIQQFIKTYMS